MPYSDKDLGYVYPDQLSSDEYYILIDKILLNFDFKFCYEIIIKANINLHVWTSVETLIVLASELLFSSVERNGKITECGVFTVVRYSKSIHLFFTPCIQII